MKLYTYQGEDTTPEETPSLIRLKVSNYDNSGQTVLLARLAGYAPLTEAEEPTSPAPAGQHYEKHYTEGTETLTVTLTLPTIHATYVATADEETETATDEPDGGETEGA